MKTLEVVELIKPALQRIGIVGPGLMGLGIAQIAAAAGLEVFVLGRNAHSVATGRQRLFEKFEIHASKGRLTYEVAMQHFAMVRFVCEYADLVGCQLVIECVPEDRPTKLAVLRSIEDALPNHTLLASNTSGLPIGGLGRELNRPGQFIGLHFFSPVERMTLVEVVPGTSSTELTMSRAFNFLHQLGRQPILVRDGPGFFTSRVFAAYLDEAVAMVGEGISPVAVEQASLQNGRLIGPLALLDNISLKLNWEQARQAEHDGLDKRFCRTLAMPVLDQLIALGRYGRKKGGGFYDSTQSGNQVLWHGLMALYPPKHVQPTLEIIQKRLRCAEAMEALRCLEEGVISNADDADKASLLGLGFPVSKGGILCDVQTQGLKQFINECDGLAPIHGQRFLPSVWLRQVAEDAKGLDSFRKQPIQ